MAEVSRALPGSGSRAADQAVIVEGNLTVSADRSGMAIGVVHGNVSPPDLVAPGQAASLATNYAQNVALTAAARPAGGLAMAERGDPRPGPGTSSIAVPPRSWARR